MQVGNLSSLNLSFPNFGEKLIYLEWDVESYWSKLGLLLNFSSNTKGNKGMGSLYFLKASEVILL